VEQLAGRLRIDLFDDMCIAENVDEDYRPVPPGEVGSRLLVTNLFNLTQPLIRFEVTDLVAVEPEPCQCGRTLMRLRSLEGRAEEVLRLGGVDVHPLQFALVTADPDVREFQVVQQGEAARLARARSGRPVRRSGRVRLRPLDDPLRVLDHLAVVGHQHRHPVLAGQLADLLPLRRERVRHWA
jgi:hypothetical protein